MASTKSSSELISDLKELVESYMKQSAQAKAMNIINALSTRLGGGGSNDTSVLVYYDQLAMNYESVVNSMHTGQYRLKVKVASDQNSFVAKKALYFVSLSTPRLEQNFDEQRWKRLQSACDARMVVLRWEIMKKQWVK